MRVIVLRFLFLMIAVSFISCTEEKSNFDLKFSVSDSEGKPIKDAVVKINDDLVGATDKAGSLKTTINALAGKEIEISITKESDRYYFAPFYENYRLDLSEKTPHLIEATLYFVPKPNSQDIAALKSTEENQAKEKLASKSSAEEKTDVAEKDEKEGESTAESNDSAPKSEDQDDMSLALDLTSPQINETTNAQSNPNTQLVFTLHVYSGNHPIKEALVYFGNKLAGNLTLGCKTNNRGRCIIRFSSPAKYHFIFKKNGYQTVTRKLEVKDGSKTRVNLKRGNTIDIFAMTRIFNHSHGLAGVDVYVKGSKVGKTDEFGHLSYTYVGQRNDLVDVRLELRGYLPEQYESDIVVSGPVSLVRYFSPLKPPAVRISLLKLQAAGTINSELRQAFSGVLDQQLEQSARKYLFTLQSFKDLSSDELHRRLVGTGQTLSAIVKRGWHKTDLKAGLDVLIRPTLVVGNQKTLELSFIDSKGRVIVAAKETLDDLSDASAVDHAFASITKKIKRKFPFEGAVLGQEDSQVTINLGSDSGRLIQKGDKVEVYGVQAGPYGRTYDHKKIATLLVEDVWQELSRCRLVWLAPRASLHRGDLVVVRGESIRREGGRSISVISSRSDGGRVPVAQANVYFNNRWLGATDESGQLMLRSTLKRGSGILKVIKNGYRDFTRETVLTKKQKIEIPLVRELAFLRIESKPSAADVYVDGRKVGVTPFSSPVSLPTGFAKLELKGVDGYKKFSQILDLDEGTLELTGPHAILLEKDVLSIAGRLISSENYTAAIDRLRQVAPDHSDFLAANHKIGELYLNVLEKPFKAAEYFAKVTGADQVRNFNDKRFISSHINEGVALFLCGEKLQETKPMVAKAHYSKAAEVLASARPYIRFVPKSQYNQARHTVAYFEALSLHKLWVQTKDPGLLNSAYKAWKGYLGENANEKTQLKIARNYLDNAQVYYKQAESSLNEVQ